VTHVRQILGTHPATIQVDVDALVACIEACFDCAQTCTTCADACLAEPDAAAMARCIALCQNSSDVAIACGRLLSRPTALVPMVAETMVQACRDACRQSGEECERHAPHHEHCRICAEMCRTCEQACDALLRALSA
jgi:hypothetical protein